MALGEAVIIAGVGCRRGASAATIEAALAVALAQAGAERIDALATAAFKKQEQGIVVAAATRQIPLILIEQSDLARVNNHVTHSRRVAALTGVGSVAEAAALVAGGPAARLLVRRIVVGPVTCALAFAETPARTLP
jgi:cobalt-precorrin 5A hydrolase